MPVQVFVISERKIADKGYLTLYKYVTSTRGGGGGGSLVGAAVLRAPQHLQPVVYMFFHL